MKLGKSFIFLVGLGRAASFEKCEAIAATENESEKGPKCADETCQRRCNPGYTALKPTKVTCEKEDAGVFVWSKTLGGCVTCKDLEGLDVTLTSTCKVNSNGQNTCKLECPVGSLFNGKEGKTEQKLFCKCNKKTGKCNWRNEKKKKINKAIYQTYKCVGDSADPPQPGPTDNDVLTTPGTNDPTAPPPSTAAPPAGECQDPNNKYGVVASTKGFGGCPPKLVNNAIVNGEANFQVPGDPHAMVGIHLDKKSFIVSGVGAERPGFEKLDAFLARYDLCENMADYSNNGKNPLAVGLDSNGDKCKKNLKWSWTSGRSGKDDMFGYVAASPDKSYLIAVGLRQGKNTKTFHRWVVKINSNTGATIWEFSMPSTDTRAGKHSGYESVVFTEDGGFIAGGFAQGIYDGMPAYKSGGQVDGGIPIAEKFSPDVAAATTSFTTTPTPQWSYICDKDDASSTMCKNVAASFNTMRTFKENGVEKLAVTFRMPKPAVLTLETMTGKEDRFKKMQTQDSYQDIEVEQDAAGNVTGFVIGGLTGGIDTINTFNKCTEAKPCDAWNGFILKMSADLTTEVWRRQWADFPGGVGEYAPNGKPVEEAGGSLVFTECWGITKTPTGYAVACGQGIENHAHKGDPRVDWRGTAVGVNFDGTMDWYRMDNWGPEQPGQGTSSAAYEWVTMHPDDPTTLVFISDDAYGFAFATHDTTQRITPQ